MLRDNIMLCIVLPISSAFLLRCSSTVNGHVTDRRYGKPLIPPGRDDHRFGWLLSRSVLKLIRLDKDRKLHQMPSSTRQTGARARSTFHHIVSPTALIYRRYSSSLYSCNFVSVWSLPEMSAVCNNVAEITCGRAAPTGFALPVAQQTLRCRGGSLSRAHSVGRSPYYSHGSV